MSAPETVNKVAQAAKTYGRLILTLAAGLGGVFSRKAGGLQENQVFANLLWRFGVSWNFAGIIDIAALVAGGIDLSAGLVVAAIPHMIGGPEKANEAAKWVLYPAGAFLIGRGGELILASIMVGDNQGNTIGSEVQARMRAVAQK